MVVHKLKMAILTLVTVTLCSSFIWISPADHFKKEIVPAAQTISGVSSSAKKIVLNSFRYSSTIDHIDNLFAKYSYDSSKKKLPIVVLLHGYEQDASSMTDWIMNDMASYGFFAISVGMRGRNKASGKMDVSGRELYDVIDAVEYVKNHFAANVDPTNINVSGYSGGGGNVFGLAAKFPDYFNVYVSHFGIADYGYDPKNSWWVKSKTRQTSLKKILGDTPQSNNAKYYARAHQYGVGENLQGGYLYMFHDAEDNNVQAVQSAIVKEQLDLHQHKNYSLNISKKGDAVRWLHASPEEDQQVRSSRDIWGKAVLAKTYPQWTIANKGKILVQGYIQTKRFSIWLGDGTQEVAEVVYDTSIGIFTVTPLTGEMKISITLGTKSVAKTISKAEQLVVKS